ncbi:MAG: hypothetical protein MZU97_02185 [Bacillus subtilis]|nr:hypothetical protein [Bacillus subtilis]
MFKYGLGALMLLLLIYFTHSAKMSILKQSLTIILALILQLITLFKKTFLLCLTLLAAWKKKSATKEKLDIAKRAANNVLSELSPNVRVGLRVYMGLKMDF